MNARWFWIPIALLMGGVTPLAAAKANASATLPADATRRHSDGSFYVTALVNGAPIRFLVDTGSDIVVLRAADAVRAGIKPRRAAGMQAVTTLAGDAHLAMVRLARVEFGGISRNDIEAGVMAGALDVSLLGQSWLAKLNALTIEGDLLRMR